MRTPATLRSTFIAQHQKPAPVAGKDALNDLLTQLKTGQQMLADKHGKYVPIALKIAPDMEAGQVGQIARLLMQHRIDG